MLFRSKGRINTFVQVLRRTGLTGLLLTIVLSALICRINFKRLFTPPLGDITRLRFFHYSRMYMGPYFIQYSSTYPSYRVSQRPIVASNNLVKSKPDYSKEGEKDMKQDNQYLQPMWCPLGLSHTQKRRLQRMRKKESMEQQAEIVPARLATMKQVWRPKQVVSSSA